MNRDVLVRLQRWYQSQCDGDWEEQFGVRGYSRDSVFHSRWKKYSSPSSSGPSGGISANKAMEPTGFILAAHPERLWARRLIAEPFGDRRTLPALS
jgi:hypothetical protein